jgi:hypothetical protein
VLLWEVLDDAAPLKTGRTGDRTYRASAEIGGRTIEFRMDRWGQPVEVDGRTLMPWNFTFVELGDEHPQGETYAGTGRGGEFRVFATAKAFLEKAVWDREPGVIYFEADKTGGGGRGRLYQRLVRRWHPPGYSYRLVDTDKHADYHSFVRNED